MASALSQSTDWKKGKRLLPKRGQPRIARKRCNSRITDERLQEGLRPTTSCRHRSSQVGSSANSGLAGFRAGASPNRSGASRDHLSSMSFSPSRTQAGECYAGSSTSALTNEFGVVALSALTLAIDDGDPAVVWSCPSGDPRGRSDEIFFACFFDTPISFTAWLLRANWNFPSCRR
jgi:hypothetical protein